MEKCFFLDYLVPVSLNKIGLYSEDAAYLLAGTCAVESDLGKFNEQIGGGPALGIYQMEPNTYNDIWNNYLKYRDDLSQKIWALSPIVGSPPAIHLKDDLILATQMARIHYFRVKEKLPSYKDIEGMAKYWKKYYNTEKGGGKKEDFIKKYKEHIG